MSMIYCHEHGRHVDTDVHEECPECLQTIVHESPLVELLTYDAVPTARTAWRDMWAVAQYVGPPATALPHWHVWTYYRDMAVAMNEAMANAKRGGTWAVVAPAPDRNWRSERTLNEHIG